MLSARDPVVFFANGHGDSILNLPAIRALARLFSDRLTLVCDKGTTRRYYSDIDLKRVIEIEISWSDPHRFHYRDLAWRIGQCDLFISLTPWFTHSFNELILLLNGPRSCGFFDDFDFCLPLDLNKHSATLAFDIPKSFDPNLCLGDFSGPPSLPFSAKQKARAFRSGYPKVSGCWQYIATLSLRKCGPAIGGPSS